MRSALEPLGIPADKIAIEAGMKDPWKVTFDGKKITTDQILAALKKKGEPAKVIEQ